jgi:hypothetical protein
VLERLLLALIEDSLRNSEPQRNGCAEILGHTVDAAEMTRHHIPRSKPESGSARITYDPQCITSQYLLWVYKAYQQAKPGRRAALT